MELKTLAVRFHEHLEESLLRFGFKKPKHDLDLWMIHKLSHYEYLVAYVEDILIWSKDLTPVIKSLEKIYLMKNVGISEYYLVGYVEILREAWMNPGPALDLSARTYIKNIISKFISLGLFVKEFKPVKTPMSEGYHVEIDDSPLCNEEVLEKCRSITRCCMLIIV
jgi:hypothetical protein